VALIGVKMLLRGSARGVAQAGSEQCPVKEVGCDSAGHECFYGQGCWLELQVQHVPRSHTGTRGVDDNDHDEGSRGRPSFSKRNNDGDSESESRLAPTY
jgi:hypothetical protein